MIVDEINVNEARRLLYDLLKEEEQYLRSNRFYNSNMMCKYISRIVVDILHFHNRTQEKLLKLILSIIFNNHHTQSEANTIIEDIENYVRTTVLGSEDSPSYYKISVINNEICDFTMTNSRLCKVFEHIVHIISLIYGNNVGNTRHEQLLRVVGEYCNYFDELWIQKNRDANLCKDIQLKADYIITWYSCGVQGVLLITFIIWSRVMSMII